MIEPFERQFVLPSCVPHAFVSWRAVVELHPSIEIEMLSLDFVR